MNAIKITGTLNLGPVINAFIASKAKKNMEFISSRKNNTCTHEF